MSENHLIEVNDDFDLKKITDSGQAFRIKQLGNGFFRFVCLEKILYIRPMNTDPSGRGSYLIETFSAGKPADPLSEWNDFWSCYFDMKRSYSEIRKKVPDDDAYMRSACDNGTGLRILRQDPWEMLITFIISQRKSIPAIRDSVERICSKYGKAVKTGYEELYLFPSADSMRSATEQELKDCKLGYRVSYIEDAVRLVADHELDLSALVDLDYETVFTALKNVRGVGDKVSNCICLFAYSKTEAAPVDTWIAKVIEQKYAGENPFPAYGDAAGIMQQYIFYYALTHKDSLQ